MEPQQPLRICLVDMNNGVANQATRCFRRIVDALKVRARAANPGLEIIFKHVQPRNLGELPDQEVDIVLSSGGPGSPYDGWDDPWCTGYREFLDSAVERNLASPQASPKVFVVCHSFELSCNHFKVATMRRRPDGTKFGVMPVYITEAGQSATFLKPFGDRLFSFEHRDWEAVDLDEARLQSLGGRVLARESRAGRTDKGTALLAFDFAPGISGTQFHPEADLAGVLAWVLKPEQAERFKKVYGETLYERMVKTLDNPDRVARTFAMLIPTWLTEQFNQIAAVRGLKPIGLPVQNVAEFTSSEPKAVAV